MHKTLHCGVSSFICKRLVVAKKGIIHILRQERGGVGSKKWQFLLIFSTNLMRMWVRVPKKGPKHADVIYHMDGPKGIYFTAL